MRVLESNVEAMQDDLQKMQITLEGKASKGELLELEGRVDECAHIDIVDDLRDAMGAKPSGEAFMALEEEVNLKAGKTDIQRLLANADGKAERTARQLREEMKALTTKEETEKLEDRIKEMLSSIDGDAASNFEQITEQHSQTEEMLEQIRVALDERATLTELGQIEDAMNLLAGRDDLARVSAESSSKIKALQIKMDKSALDLRNISGTLEVVEKDMTSKASKVDLYQQGLKLETFMTKESLDKVFKQTANHRDALTKEVKEIKKRLATKADLSQVPTYDLEFEKVYAGLADRPTKEEHEDEMELKANQEEVDKMARMSDHMQTELAYLAKVMEELRVQLEKGGGGGKGPKAARKQEMMSQMMAFRQMFAAEQRQRKASINPLSRMSSMASMSGLARSTSRAIMTATPDPLPEVVKKLELVPQQQESQLKQKQSEQHLPRQRSDNQDARVEGLHSGSGMVMRVTNYW